MHRIDTDGHVSNLFSDGDPGIGQPGTRVDAAWANAIQEEIAGFIESRGITLNKADHTQLADAINSYFPAMAWVDATLQTGWSNAALGSGRVPLAYWKDAAGIVHLRGCAKADGTSAWVTSLPTGFRTAGGIITVTVFDVTNGLTLYGKIEGGIITLPQSGLPSSGVVYCFDAISFVAEA